MNTNTQTPRTDAAEQRDITGLGVVPVGFARRLECELADFRVRTKEIIDEDHERILALIHERDTYKYRAEERRALRTEIEQALGMESKPGDTSDESLKQGLATIAALRAALARVTAERDEALRTKDQSLEVIRNQSLHLGQQETALAALRENAATQGAYVANVCEEAAALRARVAELTSQLAAYGKYAACEETTTSANLIAKCCDLEQRNAELVAALRLIQSGETEAWPEDIAEDALARAETATPAKQSPAIDAEALIAACIPGGSICDPQQVADTIREYLRPQEPCGGRCGDPECDLDTNGVTMRTPAPHADTDRHLLSKALGDALTIMRRPVSALEYDAFIARNKYAIAAMERAAHD